MSFLKELKEEIIRTEKYEDDDGNIIETTYIGGVPAKVHRNGLIGLLIAAIPATGFIAYKEHRTNIEEHVPTNLGHAAIDNIISNQSAFHAANPHTAILRNRPEFTLADVYQGYDTETQLSIDNLDCDFGSEEAVNDYVTNMMEAFVIIDEHKTTQSSKSAIQKCFWNATSHADFLDQEMQLYKTALTELASDPFVTKRIALWTDPDRYKNEEQAAEQFVLKSELIQYISDHIRASFNLPPIPAILDTKTQAGKTIPENYGGYYSRQPDDIGIIVLNLRSSMNDSFRSAFGVVLLEEIKHSIDLDLAAIAIDTELQGNNETQNNQHDNDVSWSHNHGLLTAVSDVYDAPLIPPSAGNIAKNLYYKNYLNSFIERTAKELKEELATHFFQGLSKQNNVTHMPKTPKAKHTNLSIKS